MTQKRIVLFRGSSYPERANRISEVKKQIPKRHITVGSSAMNDHIANAEHYKYAQNREKLDKLVRTSNEVLFNCHTVFPFDFFPDSLVIDKTKISIITKVFFFSGTVHSILIKNVKDIEMEAGIFFATMHIIPDVYLGQSTSIAYLNKSDALEARRIIQGLAICTREGIDLSGFSVDDIRDKVDTLGKAYSDVPLLRA